MAQCCLRLLLRLEAYKAELAELAIFGELKAAVSQCAKGRKQLPEPLLLHLGEKGHDEEPGIPRAKKQTSWTPRGPGGHPAGEKMATWSMMPAEYHKQVTTSLVRE